MSPRIPRILVVDDNPATRYSTSRVLRGAGWTVIEAENGQGAIEKACQGIDLMVLDVNLPDFDGFEVCRRIRAQDSMVRLPVLHLSATFTQDGYLTHPIEPPVLVATVNAFLRARQAEADLRESEARFKSVFDNAPIGVALLDENLAFVDGNAAMRELLGREREAIVGHSIDEFVAPAMRDTIQAVHRDVGAAGVWRGMLTLLRADGAQVESDWNLSKQETPGLRLAIVADVTDRLRYEKERERLLASERTAREAVENANQLKDDFLATLSHELRTPLNAIIGWAQVARTGQLPPAEVDKALDVIERNGRVQADMIADLLDISRITSGKIRLNLQKVNPAEVIEAALAAVQPNSFAKGVRLEKFLDAAAGAVNADPARLQQVVWNLVTNAVKFTPAGGLVEVELRARDRLVEIVVRDNGIGFSESLLPQIFDRFRQGEGGSAREHGGLGLGLAIVKQLVEMHGGTVKAESPGRGQGATFSVTLPVAGARLDPVHVPFQIQLGASTPRVEEKPIDLSGVRVLVVEDDPDSLALLVRIVSDCKAEVQGVDNVSEALERVDKFQPQVLVSDLGMPRQDGFDLIRALRAEGHSVKELPAIALTAFARGEDRQRALKAGFQFHLAKPVEASELTTAVAALCGRTG